MYRNIILPASILAGAIMGAGIFSLPFVFKLVGLPAGIFYLVLFSFIFVFVHLIYADLILRTSGGQHRFVGYMERYFGRKGFWTAFFIGFIQLLFVLTIYLILAPSFLKLFMPGDQNFHLITFWILGSVTILISLWEVAFLEFISNLGIAIIIFLIFIMGIGGYLDQEINLSQFNLFEFIAVGPILFSLAGSVAIPELIEYFRESKIPISHLRKSIFLGTLIPVFIYFLFVVGVLGFSPAVTPDAISGLVGAAPDFLLVLIGILGLLSLLSSYIVVGFNIREIFSYDFLFSNWASKLIIVFIPISLYFLGFDSFIEGVGFVGKIFLSLECIFIVGMWIFLNKKAETPPILVGKWAKLAAPIVLLAFFIVLIYAILN